MKRPTDLTKGIIAILAFNILSSFQEVASGHLEQTVSPLLFLGICFLIATLIFQSVSLRQPSEYRKPLAYKKQLSMINALTLLGWLGYFLGVKLLEPAIVSTLMVGLGPALSLGFNLLWKRQLPSRAEGLGAAGIVVVTVGLSIISLLGKSSLPHVSTLQTIAGFSLVLASAAADVAIVYSMKDLSNGGCTPASIMAHRFYLTIACTLLLALVTRVSWYPILQHWPLIMTVATFGVSLGLLCFQFGVSYTPPFTTILLSASAPFFTFVFEFLDPRLHPSVWSATGILLITIFSLTPAVLQLSNKKRIPNYATRS